MKDMFKEIIKLKIKEIEDKFLKGENLKIEEITLLLLNSNLDEVAVLSEKVNEMQRQMDLLKDNVNKFELESKLEFEKFKNEELKERVELKENFNKSVGSVENYFNILKSDFLKLELDIQKTLTNTMKWTTTNEENPVYYYYDDGGGFNV